MTDSMSDDEIVRRAEAELGDSALFLPTLWAGSSDHHLPFPGTVSFSHDTYSRMLIDILESLVGSGFKRILLLNGHGGNRVPAQVAMYEVQKRHSDARDLWLVLATWYDLVKQQIVESPLFTQNGIRHSCELETSLILSLRPELVQMDVAESAHVPFESAFYCPDGERPSSVYVARPINQVSKSGAYGRPELGTAEKGEKLLDMAVEQVIACVRDMTTWEAFEPN